jgi:hypothetical protein
LELLAKTRKLVLRRFALNATPAAVNPASVAIPAPAMTIVFNFVVWDTKLEDSPVAFSETPFDLKGEGKASTGFTAASKTAPVTVAVDNRATTDIFCVIGVFIDVDYWENKSFEIFYFTDIPNSLQLR